MDRASAITQTLMSHQFADLFLKPVHPVKDNVPDYLQVIKHPMDLQTVSQKLKRSAYATWQEWAADVDLIFDNCIAYNGTDSIFGNIANYLKGRFHKLLIPLKIQSYDGWIEHSQNLYRRILACLKCSPGDARNQRR
jgi:hypothetical protein